MDQHDARAALNTAKGSGRRFGRRMVEAGRKRLEEAGVEVDAFERRVESGRAAIGERADEATARVAADPRGQKFRETSERLGRRLATVPGITVPRDVIQSRYDLRGRVARLESEPRSLDELIWTAVAVQQVEAGLLQYRRVRAVSAGAQLAVGQFGSAAMQVGNRLAGRLADDDRPPPLETLLRSAFGLAVSRLRADPTDAAAHYGLARIYLLTDDPGPAAVSARAAVRTTADRRLRGDALTALAFAGAAADDRGSAERAAAMAIDVGVTTAHLVLAHLIEIEHDTAGTERRETAAGHRRAVSDDDHERYFGPRPSHRDVARSVWDGQKEKGRSLRDELRRGVDGGLERLRAELATDGPGRPVGGPDGGPDAEGGDDHVR